jgi:hypothetical protein
VLTGRMAASDGFGGFSLGMPLSAAEERAKAMYSGVFGSVKSVNPIEAPLDVLFERNAKVCVVFLG